MQKNVSLNLHRRHLDETQRGMVAAKIANMKQGRQDSNTSIDVFISQKDATALLNVSVPTVQRATYVMNHGTEELVNACLEGMVSVNRAAEIAKLPPEEQKQAMTKPKTARKRKPKATTRNEMLGEFLTRQKKEQGLNPGTLFRGTRMEPPKEVPTLSEVGIPMNTLKHWYWNERNGVKTHPSGPQLSASAKEKYETCAVSDLQSLTE